MNLLSQPCSEKSSILDFDYLTTLFCFVQYDQRYAYRVLQTIQMKLILFCVWAERAVLGSAKTVLKFKGAFLVFLGCFSAYAGQPHNHIG